MKSPVLIIFVSALLLGCTATTTTDSQKGTEDYAKNILGKWVGSKQIVTFYADGRWAVQRNEDSAEEIRRRLWRIDGKKLTLIYPGDYGLETEVYTIVSFSPQMFITEKDGHREQYERLPESQTPIGPQ